MDKMIRKLSDDNLDEISGGVIFNASGIAGSDPQRPWEVLDNHNGQVLDRFGSKVDAEDWTRNKYGNESLNTMEIGWDQVRKLRGM